MIKRNSLGQFVKGNHYSPKTEFKKGLIPWNKNRIIKECLICHKKFEVNNSRAKKAKFCSHKCYWMFMLGQPTWASLNPEKMREKFIGKKSSSWKGGKHKHQNRWYVYSFNHPFAHSHCPYLLRSRLIAEKCLGRYLTIKEVIHHIGETDNDKPEMLYLFSSQSKHNKYHRNPYQLKSNLSES